MTCRECQDLMLEVARNRAAPFVRRTVLEHTASCATCAVELERGSSVTAGLRAIALKQANTMASSDLESRLLKTFASIHGHGEPVQSADAQGSPAIAIRWVALAATVALCAAGLTWWMARVPRVSAPAVAAVSEPVRPTQISPNPRIELPRPEEVVATNNPRPGRRPARHSTKRPIQAVGFVPIPSAEGLPEFESGQIVRLGIPVTALPNYGVEIPPGSAAAVQADLLVGQDGQPRAIRLVNTNAQDAHPRQ
jgi:hypothetical protein